MIYSLTDKLEFAENPKIEIKDKVITVDASAETAMTLLEILDKEGEYEAAMKAVQYLFSKADQKIIKDLKLSTKDFITLIRTAMSLCLGEDPDADEQSE